MPIDLHEMSPTYATKSGDVIVRNGEARLRRNTPGVNGILEFDLIEPTGMVRWVSASLVGVRDQSTDAVRVRLSDGSTQFYIDESDDLRIKPVTDESDWTECYFGPDVLGNLDLWTKSQLKLIVCLYSTRSYPDPRCRSMIVVMDLPAWKGAVTQATMAIVSALGDVRPILVHEETLSAARSEWKIGNDYSEHGIVLTDLVQVTLNGVHKSAQLSNGSVTLLGPAAQAGDSVAIAVMFRPDILVRRSNEIKTIEKLPVWIVTNLVQNRTRELTGRLSPIEVNGVRVHRRMLDLQVSFRGVGHRQVDSLAMRAAVLEHFAGGVEITLDSCRSLQVSLDDTVEVLPRSGEGFPEAVGQLRCIMHEYTNYSHVNRARVTDDDGNITVATTSIQLYVGEEQLPYAPNSMTIETGSVSSD